MKAAVYHAPGDIRIEDVPDPKIQQPTDAIVRVTHACICGSDLWCGFIAEFRIIKQVGVRDTNGWVLSRKWVRKLKL